MARPDLFSSRITRRGLLRAGVRGSIGLTSLTLGGIGWARCAEPNWIETTYHDIYLPHLPRAFDGFKIAHLSDLHIDGTHTDEEWPNVAGYTNSLGADAIVISGDFVSYWNATIGRNLHHGLAELKAPVGVFGVLGNHDCWNNKGPHVRKALKKAGVIELFNDFHIVERNGQQLYLSGLDDLWVGEPDIAGLAARIPKNRAVVVLGHEPDFADEISETGKFGLMLSGHSHGGQVAMPFIGPVVLPKYCKKYPTGRYEVNGMTLYTNRGIGMVGFPIRFCARPEIAVFTLRA